MISLAFSRIVNNRRTTCTMALLVISGFKVGKLKHTNSKETAWGVKTSPSDVVLTGIVQQSTKDQDMPAVAKKKALRRAILLIEDRSVREKLWNTIRYLHNEHVPDINDIIVGELTPLNDFNSQKENSL